MTLVDLNNIDNLAYEIEIGRIWYGGPAVVGMAIDAINEGKVPVPDYLPDHIRPYITATGIPGPGPGPVEPMSRRPFMDEDPDLPVEQAPVEEAL